jgi:hypothetical protein
VIAADPAARQRSDGRWRVGGAGAAELGALPISITTARFGPRGRRLRAPAPETAAVERTPGGSGTGTRHAKGGLTNG